MFGIYIEKWNPSKWTEWAWCCIWKLSTTFSSRKVSTKHSAIKSAFNLLRCCIFILTSFSKHTMWAHLSPAAGGDHQEDQHAELQESHVSRRQWTSLTPGSCCSTCLYTTAYHLTCNLTYLYLVINKHKPWKQVVSSHRY